MDSGNKIPIQEASSRFQDKATTDFATGNLDWNGLATYLITALE